MFRGMSKTRGGAKASVAAVAVFGLAAAVVSSAVSASAQGKTVWDGVYTAAQAKRGEQFFAQRCAQCHSADLRGSDLAPALMGEAFAANWDDMRLDSLFEIMRATMPQDQPGGMPRELMVDVLAFMLQRGGFPAGATELVGQRDPLSEITYVSRKP